MREHQLTPAAIGRVEVRATRSGSFRARRQPTDYLDA
jgi:hypothetical protein